METNTIVGLIQLNEAIRNESAEVITAIQVLSELSNLLEEYAPTWYGEAQRTRVSAALKLPAYALVELCALLEDYAPAWYTAAQRDRALGTLRDLGILEQ